MEMLAWVMLGICMAGFLIFKQATYCFYDISGQKQISQVCFGDASFFDENCRVPLLEFPLDLSECVGTFICKHMGDYRMTIKNVEIDSLWDSGVSISAQIESNNGQRKIIFYKPEIMKFNRKDGSGSFYIDFSVPDMIPLNTELLVRVRVSGDVKKFFDINPKVIFRIEKHLDDTNDFS